MIKVVLLGPDVSIFLNYCFPISVIHFLGWHTKIVCLFIKLVMTEVINIYKQKQ